MDPSYDDLWNALAELARLLLTEENPRLMLHRVAELAATTIDSVEEVGVTIAGDGRPVTDAATSGVVFEVDNFQYDLGEGPCLHALESGEKVEVVEMRTEPRWPVYCEFAAHHGLGSSLSFPLEANGERIGVVNMYSRRTGPFSDHDRWAGEMFATQAAVAVANSRTYSATKRLTEQLQEALSSRSTIEQAKGILMERHGLDEEGAFQLLKQQSQHQNRKLRVLAMEMVAEVSSRADPED